MIVKRLSGFAVALRSAGLRVPPDQMAQATEAVAALRLRDADSLYWSLQATLVKRHEDLGTFDRVFDAYWWSGSGPAMTRRMTPPSASPSGGRQGEGEAEAGADASATSGLAADEDLGESVEVDADHPAERGLASRIDVLTSKTFPEYAPEDYRQLLADLAELEHIGPWRPRRRTAPARHGRVDMRRTLRAGFETGGYPLRQLQRRSTVQQRRLVVVCDVSGSMEPYVRAVLTFAFVALMSRRRVEAFAFATRLTRITKWLLLRDLGQAMTVASEAVQDWGGGTRVGDCLARLDRDHRGTLHGAVVVIASDGWDLGDPALLSSATAAIRRRAHAVVWVNPHLQDPEFEPLTRGMSAALPHIDHFVPYHDRASLIDLVALLDRL